MFIPLLNLSTHEQFLSALAKGLDLSLTENRLPDAQILDYLRQKQVLLILDNFEQLVDEKQNLDIIVELLIHAPGTKILVTSREYLNLHEEFCYLLDGLSYPSDPLEQIATPQNFDALALFEKRARKINQNFRLGRQNLLPVLTICSLLQGHPLGIELVASMTPRQVWEDLLAEFVNSLHNLESQFSNAPANHKTLRIVFDASWRDLPRSSSVLWSNLSLCRGGFTEKTAAYLAQASKDLLEDLVGKSLLRQDAAGRYGFHEAVRQYAQEKLKPDSLRRPGFRPVYWLLFSVARWLCCPDRFFQPHGSIEMDRAGIR